MLHSASCVQCAWEQLVASSLYSVDEDRTATTWQPQQPTLHRWITLGTHLNSLIVSQLSSGELIVSQHARASRPLVIEIQGAIMGDPPPQFHRTWCSPTTKKMGLLWISPNRTLGILQALKPLNVDELIKHYAPLHLVFTRSKVPFLRVFFAADSTKDLLHWCFEIR